MDTWILTINESPSSPPLCPQGEGRQQHCMGGRRDEGREEEREGRRKERRREGRKEGKEGRGRAGNQLIILHSVSVLIAPSHVVIIIVVLLLLRVRLADRLGDRQTGRLTRSSCYSVGLIPQKQKGKEDQLTQGWCHMQSGLSSPHPHPSNKETIVFLSPS